MTSASQYEEIIESLRNENRHQRKVLEERISGYESFTEHLKKEMERLMNEKKQISSEMYSLVNALEMKQHELNDANEKIGKYKEANRNMKKKINKLTLERENQRIDRESNGQAGINENFIQESTGGGGRTGGKSSSQIISNFSGRGPLELRVNRDRGDEEGQLNQVPTNPSSEIHSFRRPGKADTSGSAYAPKSLQVVDIHRHPNSLPGILRGASLIFPSQDAIEEQTPMDGFITKMQNSANNKLKNATNQFSIILEACTPMAKMGRNNPNSMSPDKSEKKKFDFALEEVSEELSIIKSQHNEDKKIFDEILVLGIDKKKVREVCRQVEDLSARTKLNPEILYRNAIGGRNKKGSNESNLTDQIANFVFPFGYYVKHFNLATHEDLLQSTNLDSSPEKPRSSNLVRRESISKEKDPTLESLIQEYVMKNQVDTNRGSKCFLSFNSEETLEEVARPTHEIIEVANPHRYWSYYCIMVEELVCIVRSSDIGQRPFCELSESVPRQKHVPISLIVFRISPHSSEHSQRETD